MSDVESKVMSPPKSTGEAVSTRASDGEKLSWIFPLRVVSLGMIESIARIRARNFGVDAPETRRSVSQLRTPKLGSGDVELSDADRGADETSCTKSEMWQLIFELGFVVAVAHASAQLMRGGIAGGSTETSIPLVSVLGFVVAGCSMYVAAGSWDDKCGPTSGDRIRRPPRRRIPRNARVCYPRTRPTSGRHRRAVPFPFPCACASRTDDTARNTPTSKTRVWRAISAIAEELSLEDVAAPPLATARETSKAIKKYKKMRDNGFDLENFSEYAQSDATSVMSEQAVLT